MDRDDKQVFPVTYKIFFHDPPLSAAEVKSVADAKGEIVEMERTPTLKAALEVHRHLCTKYGVS